MCGIFGITDHSEASNLTYLGLYALQHRGQESAGIVSSNGERLFKIRRRSLVSETFEQRSFEYLKGPMAIGHVRYSTQGENVQRNVQPFIGTGSFGDLSVAHNGNITNFFTLRRKLEERGAVFQSTMDTEVILHLVATAPGKTVVEKIQSALGELEGSFSLLFLTPKEMIAARDPMGFRPLSLGWLKKSPVVSSESCAFDLIEAKYEREIEPGEMIVFQVGKSPKSIQYAKPKRLAHCVFEHIYFARPDSQLFGESVYEVRKNLGRELAREHPLEADVVIPVPDSGFLLAMGFAAESGIPMEQGFIRNHYVGRTFIEPKQSIRGFGVKVKLNPVRSAFEGKRVIVIDDSIVRGTTSQKIVKMIRDAGAKEVFMLIGSPPVIGPCFYGIDTPTRKELIGSHMSVDAICKFVGADRLHYLSLDGVYRAIKTQRNSFCDACFSDKYQTPIDPEFLKRGAGAP